MAVQFWDNVVLFDSGSVAMHDDCCCGCSSNDDCACTGGWPNAISVDISNLNLAQGCEACDNVPDNIIMNIFTNTSEYVKYIASSTTYHPCGSGLILQGQFELFRSWCIDGECDNLYNWRSGTNRILLSDGITSLYAKFDVFPFVSYPARASCSGVFAAMGNRAITVTGGYSNLPCVRSNTGVTFSVAAV